MHEYVGISHIKSKTDDQKRDSVVTRIQNSPFAKIYKLLLPRAIVNPRFFRRPWINPDNLPANLPKGILVLLTLECGIDVGCQNTGNVSKCNKCSLGFL